MIYELIDIMRSMTKQFNCITCLLMKSLSTMIVVTNVPNKDHPFGPNRVTDMPFINL